MAPPSPLSTVVLTSPTTSLNSKMPGAKTEEASKVTWLAIVLGSIASIGGYMFGYESGLVSGFLAMSDFIDRFGENGSFSPARQGTIVGLLCIGTLIGCLGSGYLCDKIGRRYTISSSAFFYIIGVVIEITSSTSWVQFSMGRLVAGVGIGALSTSVPMYQSESLPKNIRGAMVSTYQLAITLGIWTAYMINYSTSAKFENSAQWRIPNGLSALWAIILGTSILLLPESPRFACRRNRVESARTTLARLNGVDSHSPLIDEEISHIIAEIQPDDSPSFKPRRLTYRILLGIALQAGQQLTGANFFFYYGTTIFRSTGIENSYITSIVLGSVNVAATIAGLWIVKNCGRRISLMVGALWMCVCFLIYSFVGQYVLSPTDPMSTPVAGIILIVFTCLFIVAFATTWGPLVWTVVSEMYPSQYRAPCMAVATASNWLFNFLISFFTKFITDKINYFYGLVFAGSCFSLFWVVYFFLCETKNRSLEEIEFMYNFEIDARKSASFEYCHGCRQPKKDGVCWCNY